ncbi:hypothetical protein OKA06_06835 [Novosphingobium sp. MW5]|nr:hypothetical protein [Novosphingobium sp. MW5]
MNGNWIWIAVAIGVCWLMFRKGRQPSMTSDAYSPTTFVSEKNFDADQQYVNEALKAHEEVWEGILEDSRHREEAKRDISGRLSIARNIITETELDRAVPNLWNHVSDWRSYEGSVITDDIPDDFANVQLEKSNDTHWVSWVWNGQSYHIACRDVYDNPVLQLQVADKIVLEMHCNIASSWPLRYDYIDISALVVGSWMAEVIKMAGLLDRASDRILYEMMDEMDQETARRIVLDEKS